MAEYMTTPASYTAGKIALADTKQIMRQFLAWSGLPIDWTPEQEALWSQVHSSPGSVTLSSDELVQSLEDSLRSVEHEKRHRAFEKLPKIKQAVLLKMASQFLKVHPKGLAKMIQRLKSKYTPKKQPKELVVVFSRVPAKQIEKMLDEERFDWNAAGISESEKPLLLEVIETIYQAQHVTEEERGALIRTPKSFADGCQTWEPCVIRSRLCGAISWEALYNSNMICRASLALRPWYRSYPSGFLWPGQFLPPAALFTAISPISAAPLKRLY